MTTARRRLVIVLAAAAVGIVALGTLVLSTAKPETMMDADGLGPKGGRALVEVLQRQGVRVDVVRSADELDEALSSGDGAGRTVFVSSSGNLAGDATRRLAAAVEDTDRLVLLSPSLLHVQALGLPLLALPGGTDQLDAECTTSPVAAGDVLIGSTSRYLLVDGASSQLCFPLPGEGDDLGADAHGAALAVVPAASDRPETIVLGATEAWTNRQIREGSNAGLALRALGSSPDLIWYEPSLADLLASGSVGEGTWPRAVWPVLLVLGAAAGVWALVQGRRFGALVPEPLPVVVRAIETTRSRGQLYRKAQDRAHAAAVLRAASLGRLRSQLALAPSTPSDLVVTAASQRSGWDAGRVSALLVGDSPTTDRALIDLARDLTDLEERTRPR